MFYSFVENPVRRVEHGAEIAHNAAMAMNLIKLCVGVDSPDELQRWIEYRVEQKRAAGLPLEQVHTTRMFPKAADDIINGGSLYWVIKGMVQCRQEIIDLRRFTDAGGVGRCDIVMKPELVLTHSHPRRPFQGWRYLNADDAPRDLTSNAATGDIMPLDMQRELAQLGLL